MRTHEIEAWALQVIEAVAAGQPNEDSRVELKAEWPTDFPKTARQIAGHCNAARGEYVLWLIGIDQKRGIVGAVHAELANWFPQIEAWFDSLVPRRVDLNIPVQGKTVVAILIETDRVPFVVKNPSYGQKDGGPVAWEVPWRENTTTRTATRSDLILLLSPLQKEVVQLEARIDPKPPDCHQTAILHPVANFRLPAYWFCLWISNKGNARAEKVQVFVAELTSKDANGEFQPEDRFQPMYLNWSHTGTNFSDGMSPGMGEHCSLGSISRPLPLPSTAGREPEIKFELDLEKKPFASPHIWSRGMYRLKLQVVAANARPIIRILEIDFKGSYSDDLTQMLSQCVLFRFIE